MNTEPFTFHGVPHDAGSAAPSDTGNMAVVETQAPDIQARPRPAPVLSLKTMTAAELQHIEDAGEDPYVICPYCNGTEKNPDFPALASLDDDCPVCRGGWYKLKLSDVLTDVLEAQIRQRCAIPALTSAQAMNVQFDLQEGIIHAALAHRLAGDAREYHARELAKHIENMAAEIGCKLVRAA